MKSIKSDQIRININEAASKQAPFFFAINYEMTEGVFINNPTEQTDIFFEFGGKGNKPSETKSNDKADITVFPILEEEYNSKFEIVKKGLNEGDINVVNLTVKTPIKTNIGCREIFLRSQSPYQVYAPNEYVCFSPERFIKIGEGKIIANPMKGTIDASIPNAMQKILNNPKEIAELDATTQAVIEELNTVANKVYIKRDRYIDRIESQNRTLLQVSSEVEGTLPKNYLSYMGDIIFSLLPAASITGFPKSKALEYIGMAEQQPRGYYCGVAGYFDGATLESAVLIRFIENENENLFFRSGGGVTSNSDSKKEYQEVLDKIYFPFV